MTELFKVGDVVRRKPGLLNNDSYRVGLTPFTIKAVGHESVMDSGKQWHGKTNIILVKVADRGEPKEPPIREVTLDTAKSLISGDRAAAYGDPTVNFTRLGKMIGAILDTEVNAAQVAMIMAALKLSRLWNTNDHQDSWIDLAGYAALGAEVSKNDSA